MRPAEYAGIHRQSSDVERDSSALAEVGLNIKLAMPRVTVVVPNYNHARYLPRRVESVLAQTFADFELLLLDDASTDDSRSVLERYAAADPRARCLFNDRNGGGPFPQWNRGVAAARGEFVWLAESDDFADPTLLDRLVGALRRHPRCGVAFCQSWEVGPDGSDDDRPVRSYKFQTAGLPDAGRWAADFVMPGPAACRTYLATRNVIPNASAAVFRRDVYRAVGGADPAFRVTGDWKLWADMMAVSDLAFVATPLNYFRHHRSNVRSATWTSGVGIVEAARVMRHVAARHQVPTGVRRTALADLAGLYVHHLLTAAAPAAVKARLLRQAMAAAGDTRFPGRVAATLVDRVGRAVGRRLAARLSPGVGRGGGR
ncbi:MAG: hypothetical protein JWO31_838 [Phycisphaerales bacterium]|nr:hypothetical protein [Phycisphaerales bacterium]